jgi:4-hydroxythreonine-4-phosphate dehydrogenase
MGGAVRLAVSVGCPCGIGAEVAVLAASALAGEDVRIVLVGDEGAIADAASLRSIDLASLPHVAVERVSALSRNERLAGRPTAEAGRSQLSAIDRALDLVLKHRADALVTGPVSKHAIASTGVPFVGHTEHLQARTGADTAVMLFAGPKLRTSLVTTHVAIADVPGAITQDGVRTTIVLMVGALRDRFAIARPRIVVTGLNPHAGEGGMFGNEEASVIEPAVRDVSRTLDDTAIVVGPIAAEAAFRQARDGAWDAVVAMYHDQATIASKLIDFGDAVNVTLGLPIVRTSVDHGTGYDIAGRGTADARGMIAAMRMAVAMVGSRSSQ